MTYFIKISSFGLTSNCGIVFGANVQIRVSFDSLEHEKDDGSCRESIAHLQRTQRGKNQSKGPKIKN